MAEPVVGKEYTFGYIDGRPFDFNYYESKGYFIKKISDENNNEIYILAEIYKDSIYLTYILKKDLKNETGKEAVETDIYKILLQVINKENFPHPDLDFSSLYPTKILLFNNLYEMANTEGGKRKNKKTRKHKKSKKSKKTRKYY
jgi:hypothetical protein